MSDDNPEFVRNYEDIRIIRNLGLRHKKDNGNPTQQIHQNDPLPEQTGSPESGGTSQFPEDEINKKRRS